MKLLKAIVLIILCAAVATLFYLPMASEIKVLITVGIFLLVFGLEFAFKSNKGQNGSDLLAKVSADKRRLGYEIQVSASQIGSVSEQIKLNLNENTSHAQQLLDEAVHMTQVNGDMNTLVATTAEKIKALIQLLDEESQTIQSLDTINEQSGVVIKKSLSEILAVVDMIRGLKQTSSDTMENMDSLLELSSEIIAILETVDGVSKQTHMLALNASIESARAGESGRGFAVVAEEIRKLALSTAESVKSINALIGNLQTAIHNVHVSAQNNLNQVDNGVTLSANVEGYLSKIEDSFSQYATVTDQIKAMKAEEVEIVRDVETHVSKEEQMIEDSEKSAAVVEEAALTQKNSLEDFATIVKSLNDTAETVQKLFDVSELQKLLKDNTENDLLLKNGFELIKNLSETLHNTDIGFHKSQLEKISSGVDYVEAIWTNDQKGRFIFSMPPAGISNANVRDWFRSSVKGERYTSEVYVSAITHTPCVTLSAPLTDITGKIIGVIGLDIKISDAGL